MGNDGLVGLQTLVEIYDQQDKHQHQYAEPEQYGPLAPQEGIVLHALRAEVLIKLRGIHLNLNDFQGQVAALHLLAIDLSCKRWKMIEIAVERRQCQHHGVACPPTVNNLNARSQLLTGLECRHLHRSTLRSLNSDSHLCLFTYHHLDRFYLCRYLCECSKRQEA